MKKPKKTYESGLSTTTMVDVLFILLIFFVLVSTVKKDSIQINAAKVDKQNPTKSQSKPTEEHVLTIDKDNKIYFNGKSMSDDKNLEQALEEIKANLKENSLPAIMLRPDADSRSTRLIEIFAIIGKVGLSEYVQIEVESK
jgi:biopolymer transport protein ExbD